MPKILENAREQLLKEAKRQLMENGYGATTIRSVAQSCGMATGTVYNYFPSKDMLIATFMMEDWNEAFSSISDKSCSDKESYLEAIYDSILSFAEKYGRLFSDKEAEKSFRISFSEKHPLLIDHLSSLILPSIGEVEDRAFTAAFIAEALIVWAMKKTEFKHLYQVISKII